MSKGRYNKFINTIDECLTNGVNNGIFQVSLEDNVLNGRTVTIGGREVVNFGSCSYLGLEVDDRLKQGAIDATICYGTQYSSSRLFSSCNLYKELEGLFYNIFDNNPAILAATTTLTHISAIPILCTDDDLIIQDHQVHGSVQLAIQLARSKGTHVEMIKHNNLTMLEDLVKLNLNKYRKIWYMADGLYSMYGDYAPIEDILSLMEKYSNFHVYFDDAHGMSWAGTHGNGYVLSKTRLHPKMVLSTSLAKGFGTGGGVLVMSDKEAMRKILTCGSSYTFSGPVQPPMLGASIASARIHLSDEIYALQNKLSEKIKLTGDLISKYELPLVQPSSSPIFYIALGLPRVGYNMVKRLLSEGFYTNIGIFPGVPVKCCGLRIAVTNGLKNEDIQHMLQAFEYHFPKVLEEEGQTIDDISTNFNLPFEQSRKKYFPVKNAVAGEFKIQHENSIHKTDRILWNQLLGGNGTFDYDGCNFLESVFRNNPEPENNWDMHYLIVKDKDDVPVLATFFSVLICKDDMVAPADISRNVEEHRKKDKYYLSSKSVMMGSLLSEGRHLYINREHPQWQKAMLEMIRIMNEVKHLSNAGMVQLRDMDSDDHELNDFLIKEGFIKVDMPDTHVVNDLTWSDESAFINTLSYKSRQHFRKNVLSNQHKFEIKYYDASSPPDEQKTNQWFELYLNVKGRSYNLNTYELPKKLFNDLCNYKGWEVIELNMHNEPVAMVFCYKSSLNNYCPMIIGMNYKINAEYHIYRQALYQMIKRGRDLKCRHIYLGMDASVEKRKFGAEVLQKSLYIQSDDNYNMESLSLLNSVN